VAALVLVGMVAAYAWSSRQPVRYQGSVKVFLDAGGDQTDPGRIVRSQAEYLTSAVVMDRTVELIDGRLTRKELTKRVTVEPARDANVITVSALDDTPQNAANLADTVVRAYRMVVAEQTTAGAQQQIDAINKRQARLNSQITDLRQQLQGDPGNAVLLAKINAKNRELDKLADQSENASRTAEQATVRLETLRDNATVPDERAQPKPLRTAAIGMMLALVVGAGLAWWLNGRRAAGGRQLEPVPTPAGLGEGSTGLEVRSPLGLGDHLGNGHVPANGAPAGNGAASGIADFDQIATSVQKLFRFMDGPSQRLYEEDLPQLAAEEIAHRFEVDMVAVLLDNAGEIQTMGSVGLRASRHGTIDRGMRHLIESAVRSGPRVVDEDELARLSSMGFGGDQADSLAVVPLVRDQVAFGMLVAGRYRNGEPVTPLSDHEVHDIANCTRDVLPYIWAWLLLRNLKLRLRTLQ
jgi:capsular polysaccharide biosynthesis protein